MPAAQRRENKSVVQCLLDEPYRFQFFQAVRLVVQWLGEHGVAPERALIDHLRFDNSLLLGFSPSQIEGLKAKGDGAINTHAALVQALLEQQMVQVRITPSFMGFLGGNGALPVHYTERFAAYQLIEKDEAPRAFLDMFSNRALALFYEAWRIYRFEHAINDGKDTLLPLLLTLAGFQAGADANNSDGVSDETIALYAGVMQQRPMSSVVLGRVLSSHFSVPIEIEEAVGYWSPLEPQEQCSLGGMNATLGDNMILGQSSWRPDLGARLRIGPLNRADFERFLPNAPASTALTKMLSLFGDQTITYEIQLILRAQEVRQICLGVPIGLGARLGRDSFLVSVSSSTDRADMSYQVRPLGSLPARSSTKRPQ
jgi:type VI secretion system protein ImpH